MACARRSRRLLLTAAFLSTCLCADLAAAQGECSPSDADIQEAQALFVAGGAAIDAGRWSDAIDNFSRAYTLTCAPSALYNYGVALRALGRHREARDAFDQLLTRHPDIGGETRSNAETYRREEGARVAVLELVGVDPDARPEMTLDGRTIGDEGERPILLETDAGSHSLVARIPDHQPFVWDGELVDGQRERIEVLFPEIPTGDGGVDAAAIIIPILVGLAVAGGIVAGVVIQDQQQLRPLFPERSIKIN